MTLLQAIAFGLVQGLGEFLPISSSAHLTLLPWVAGWEDPGLAVDVALHVGTLVALLAYFRRDLLRLGRAFVQSLVERRVGDDTDRKLAWLVALGSIPGAAIGFLLERWAEEAFRAPWLIATTMIALGLVLYVADQLAARMRPIASLSVRDAVLIGLAQACAIVPGVSRSGSTITAARALGLDREAAARFSFLLAAPIIAGAGLVKLPKLVKAGGVTPSLAIAVAVAAVSGYLAIEVLLRFVRTRSYLPFVVYRLAFGVSILCLIFVRG
jgi:undecaprenyl-diphosphatase